MIFYCFLSRCSVFFSVHQNDSRHLSWQLSLWKWEISTRKELTKQIFLGEIYLEITLFEIDTSFNGSSESVNSETSTGSTLPVYRYFWVSLKLWVKLASDIFLASSSSLVFTKLIPARLCKNSIDDCPDRAIKEKCQWTKKAICRFYLYMP